MDLRFTMRRLAMASAILLLAAASSIAAEPALSTNVAEPKFEAHIRPLFKAFCLDCHGGTDPQAKLDLRLKRSIVAGGENGPAMVVGDPAASKLVARVASGEMPPTGKKLTADQVELLKRWIAQGAATVADEPETIAPDHLFPEELSYWAFRPVVRPAIRPDEATQPRVRTDIDALFWRRLRETGLEFNADADRATLARRLFIDLTGLPPTYDEVRAFANDPSPTAYEDLVERLLASPRYGERWGRHWLDVVGYADSDGDATRDTERPYAYRYRDYVIESFNRGLPFSQMLVEQLAGDELVGAFDVRNVEHHRLLAATGMMRMPADATGNGGGDEERNQTVTSAIKMFGSAVLGMSVACAQCHDHRYDPISQVDYYRIRAVFEPALNPKAWRYPRDRWVSLYTDEDRAKVAAVEAEAAKMTETMNARRDELIAAALEKEINKLPEETRETARVACKTPAAQRSPEQTQLVATHPSLNISAGTLYQYDPAAAEELKKTQATIDAKRAEKPVQEFLSVLNETGPGPVDTLLFYRGDYRQPKQPVPPGDLRIATQGSPLEIPATTSGYPTSTGRRIALARHLVNGKHPLVGRVLANRIWLHHFGRGLVDTPGEFGNLGQRPSHPELIDWLADELVRNDWDLKSLHRTIVTSTVYRQSSARTPVNHAVDTDGSLYSRYPVRRMEAEAIRDASLAAAGRLDLALYGKPVAVEEDFAGQVAPKADSPRRSLYIEVRRSKPVALLTSFDAPVMECNCERRVNSTVATQSLMMMNNEFVFRRAEEIAASAASAAQRSGPIELAGVPRRTMLPSESWQYGYGGIDEAGAVQFTRLPQFAEGRWQGGPQLPDPALGYAMLRPEGGHPDQGPLRGAIRRWTAPARVRPGKVVIEGTLSHGSENGDGVRGRIVLKGKEVRGTWTVKNGKVDTPVELDGIASGDTIDFVVDALETHTSDSFGWTVQIRLIPADANESPMVWQSQRDFSPPVPAVFDRVVQAWRLAYHRDPTADEMAMVEGFLSAQISRLQANPATATDAERQSIVYLCQQLLASNEFLYFE